MWGTATLANGTTVNLSLGQAVLGIKTGTAITGMTALQTAMVTGINTLAASAGSQLAANKGNLGDTFKNLASSDSLKSLAAAMVTAGVLHNAGSDLGLPVNSTELVDKIHVAVVETTIKSGISTAIKGDDFADSLKTGLILEAVDMIGVEAAGQIGLATAKMGDSDFKEVTALLAHAALGCAMGEASGGSCQSGAIGGVTGEIIGMETRDEIADELKTAMESGDFSSFDPVAMQAQGVEIGKLMGGLAAAIAGAETAQEVYGADDALKEIDGRPH